MEELPFVGLLFQFLSSGYLLNKLFLAASERAHTMERARQWRIASWIAYLTGLPAWVIIFTQQQNWIAASVEASCLPTMLLGLLLAVRDTTTNPPRWLNQSAIICIPMGIGYSLYDFGGLTQLSQWLELGLVAGFLVGTYLLAKQQPAGYGWYVLMHVSCGALMWLQGHPWLFGQQLLSLLFIADAWWMSRQTEKTSE